MNMHVSPTKARRLFITQLCRKKHQDMPEEFAEN